MHKLIPIRLFIVLAAIGMGFFAVQHSIRSVGSLPNSARSNIIVPKQLISVVPTPLDEILAALDQELQKHRPEAAAALRAGITVAALRQAEEDMGVTIHPEMQQLYRWHDGLADEMELFPGHMFIALEDAISMNQQLREAYRKSGTSALMAHEDSWLILFPDGAGDGYYYDPKRGYDRGGVFYNFRETGHYMIFPSIRNLLAAVVECYQAGCYPRDATQNFELEHRIMQRYGIDVELP